MVWLERQGYGKGYRKTVHKPRKQSGRATTHRAAEVIKKHSNHHALLTPEKAGFAINFEPKTVFFPITAFRC